MTIDVSAVQVVSSTSKSTFGRGGNGIPVHNLKPSNSAKVRAALARARSGGAALHIVAVGDSITSGYQTSPQPQTAWPAKLRALLSAKWGPVAEGLAAYCPTFSPDNRYQLALPWGGLATVGFAGRCAAMALDAGGSGKLLFGPIVCDRFTVYFANATDAAAFTVQVDGQDVATIGGVSASPSVWTSASYTVVPGEHLVALKPPAAAAGTKRATILGFEHSLGAPTVKVTKAGITAMSTEDWVGNGALGSLPTTFDLLAADLYVVLLGTNNAPTLDPDSMAADLVTIIDRARTVNADVLLCVPPPVAATSPNPWRLYVAAIHDVAARKDVPLLDLTERWIDTRVDSAPYLYREDGTHPSDRGKWDIASAAADALFAAVGGDAGFSRRETAPTVDVNRIAGAGAAETLTEAPIQDLSLDAASCALTFPAPVAGKKLTLILRQNSAGSKLVTYVGPIAWPAATPPTLTTTAERVDVLTFECSDGLTWLHTNSQMDLALPATAGANIVTDDFSDANSTAIAAKATDTAQTWSVEAGATAEVQSGKFKWATGTGNKVAWVDSGEKDVEVTVKITLGAGVTYAGVVARLTDASNYWWAELLIDGSFNQIRLFQRNAGSNVQQAAISNVGLVNGQTYEVTLRCDGNDIRCLVDGIEKVAYTAGGTFNNTATKHGVMGALGTKDMAYDDFTVDHLA